MSRRMVGLWTALGFALAILAVLAPVVRSIGWNQENERILALLEERTEALGESAARRQRSLAKWYNRNLNSETPEEGYSEAYGSILCFDRDGVMGYLMAPEIGLRLPVYHGTGGHVLEKGVGHVPQTALPIGGRGNHTVLMGSAGPSTREMFQKIHSLEEGMALYIWSLGETLVYRVDSVQVMPLGWEVDTMPREGEDLLTLVADQAGLLGARRTIVQCSRSGAVSVETHDLMDRETLAAAVLSAILAGLLPAVACRLGSGKVRMENRKNVND